MKAPDTDESGRRISRILDPHWCPGRGDEPIPECALIAVDVDGYWQHVNNMSDGDQVREMAESHFWEVMLRHFGSTSQEQEKFLSKFNTPEAKKNRWSAIVGVGERRVAGAREETLVQAAQTAGWWISHPFAKRGEGPDSHVDDDGRVWDTERIGLEFIQGITGSESEKFCKGLLLLAQKKGRLEIPDNRRADSWLGFCTFVREHQCLPTHREFREQVGLGEDGNDRAKASKDLRDFGITLRQG